MKSWIYMAGRALQFFALLAMPFAIWSAEIQHSERNSIGIFVGSMALFGVGYAITRWVK